MILGVLAPKDIELRDFQSSAPHPLNTHGLLYKHYFSFVKKSLIKAERGCKDTRIIKHPVL